MRRFLAEFPSTNGRIVMTLVVVLATAVRYLCAGPPSEESWGEWLLFLAGMAGVDAAQFYAKRKTFDPPSPDSARAGIPASETTVTTVGAAPAPVVVGAPQSGGNAPPSPQPAPAGVAHPQPPVVPADGGEEG